MNKRPGSTLIEIAWGSRPVRVETAWVGADAPEGDLIVFLHEGLGSVSAWRDFPLRLCSSLNCQGLVYSRPGYGRSTPRAADEHWAPDFMDRQAHEVLPALLQALAIDGRRRPLWLFGHSDGGTIALLQAARPATPLAGIIVMAPHIHTEPIGLTSITRTREAYLQGDLRSRLARHHDEPDSAFWGWYGAWLNPAFADWRIDHQLKYISCPVLAIQGFDDEYGTMKQIHGIAATVQATTLLELPDCGHSPHRDQADAVIHAVAQFMHKAPGRRMGA